MKIKDIDWEWSGTSLVLDGSGKIGAVTAIHFRRIWYHIAGFTFENARQRIFATNRSDLRTCQRNKKGQKIQVILVQIHFRRFWIKIWWSLNLTEVLFKLKLERNLVSRKIERSPILIQYRRKWTLLAFFRLLARLLSNLLVAKFISLAFYSRKILQIGTKSSSESWPFLPWITPNHCPRFS